MTLGQRIQELRKKAGRSQEGLGEALGVSRQAVSKWESDGGIPELDTLIAMSRLFNVTIGELLGVEEPAQAQQEQDPQQNEQVEEILRRYVEESRQHQPPRRSPVWPWVLTVAALLVAIIVAVVSLNRTREVKESVTALWNNVVQVENIVSNVRNDMNGITEEIRNAINEEAKLLSTLNCTIVDVDVAAQTVTLRFNATLRNYTAGSKLQFLLDWTKVDDTTGQTVSEFVEGPDFAAVVTLPMNYHTDISVRIDDGAGSIKEEAANQTIYQLHPDNFTLSAYNFLRLIDLTISTWGNTITYSQGEYAYVQISASYPEFVWPVKAEAKAFVNGEQILKTELAIVPSEREEFLFEARLTEKQIKVNLTNGDSLEIVLTVTDNLGRVGEFREGGTVHDGELRQMPMAAPVDTWRNGELIPVAEAPEVFNRVYVYEKEGFGSPFSISIFEDGSFSYYVGMLSSYIGMGRWTLEDGILTLVDNTGLEYRNSFCFKNGDLLYIAEVSTNFMYLEVEDGERFVGEPLEDTQQMVILEEESSR